MPVRIDAGLQQASGTADLRRDAVRILECALNAVDACTVTARTVRLAGDTLLVDGSAFPLRAGARIIVIGAGKACAPMARVIEDVLGDRITGGLVIVKTAPATPRPARPPTWAIA